MIDSKELATETRSEHIANVLRDEILSGRFREGERLPSERDLTVRFEASRGAVREAFRLLEQLGLASIGPGGARVMAVENANIDIIGPLLTLHDVPDIDLVEQVLDVMGGLFKIALQQMIKRASDEELEASRGLIRRLSDSSLSAEQQMQVRMELGRFFMAKSHNLLLRLINNSLRTQVVDHERSGVLPAADPSEFADPVARLDAAIAARDTDSATRASEEIAAIDRRLVLAAIAQAHPQKDTAGATV